MLHEFMPPPGARAIQVRPGHYRDAHVLHQSPGRMPYEVVAIHRFWSVRMPLKAVIRYLRVHRLPGFRTTGAMWYSDKPHYLAMGSVSPAASRVPSRFFTVTPVGLPGRTIIRADAQVVWVYPRSPSEKIPTGVHRIDIKVPHHGRAVRVTHSAKVARIVKWFNALPISPPGVDTPCLDVRRARTTVSFRSADGALLALATVPLTSAGTCDPIGFTIGSHVQRPLIDVPLRASFIERLQNLLGLQLVQNYR